MGNAPVLLFLCDKPSCRNRACVNFYRMDNLGELSKGVETMKFEVQENYLTIYLPKDLDHHSAEEIKREADRLIERGHIRYVIFDFAGTEFCDSSGIGVIMGRYKKAFARVTVASFMTQLNPTLEEVSDVKTAVSEAVTNAIIHGYENHVNKVRIYAGIEGRTLHLEISDRGVGIPDVKKAMEPLYTTRPELERSGMGFSFMEAFMDEVQVESEPGKGTIVRMKKIIGRGRELWTTQSL